MNATTRLVGITVIAGLTTIGLVACGAAPAPPTEPVTLTMLHIDGSPDLDPAVDWFVDAVESASDGMVTVEVLYGCCEDTVTIEEDLVARVADGTADLGWVGTRAFEQLGVGTLRPLTAPFLMDGYAQQQKALESDAARAALRDLSEAGVTGLAVVPGQIRRPLAVEAPLLGLSDWAGVSIASFHSAQNAASFEALGAVPLDVTFEQRDIGLFDKTISALENSLTAQDLSREHIVPYATANVALWPRVSALIAAPDSAAVTDAALRQILLDAAAAVVARTGAFVGIDQAAIQSACDEGARFAEASAEQLEELRAAVRPIWDDLAESEETRELFDAITAARPTDPEPLAIPTGCGGSASEDAETSGTGDASLVNGHWSTPTYTYDELIEAGFAEQEAKNAAGTFVLSFDDGGFELRATTPSGQVFGCDGSYTIDGARMTVNYRAGGDCGPGGVFFTTEFAVDGSTLTLSNMGDALASDIHLFSSTPLVKVD